MAWPSANISLSNVDADSDSISSARADIYQAFTSLNDIIQAGPGSGGGTYSNATVASYLPVYAGNISANVVTTSGNINLKSAGQVIFAQENTGGFILPTGNIAQRANISGAIRYNTETGNPEWYHGSLNVWKLFSQAVAPSYTARYLVVAGGGGGGRGGASGGGAGGLLTGNTTINSGAVYTITVGAGGGANAGTGSVPVVNTGYNGNDSIISQGSAIFTAIGGGGGGPNYSQAGGDGGSGGGGGEGGGRGGYGTSGQGYDGGSGIAVDSGYWPGSGGGGAGQVGFNANARYAGFGGNGVTSNITGTVTTYAGGGGGSSYGGSGYAGSGGSGGGGAGAGGSGGSAVSGTNGLGGGGGAATNGTGGSGGNGIVILSVPNADYPGNSYVTNGTVSYSGDNSIITWTSSGSYIG